MGFQNTRNYGVVNRGGKFTYRELVLGTEELDLDLVNTKVVGRNQDIEHKTFLPSRD
jgi:hypothetical protein